MLSIRSARDVARAMVLVGAGLVFLATARLEAQQPGSISMFETERPLSLARMTIDSSATVPQGQDLLQYFMYWRLVRRTTDGMAAGLTSGGFLFVLACLGSNNADDEDETEQAFLDALSRCGSQDRVLGFLGGGSLIGTIVGAAYGAARGGECSTTSSIRRAMLGTALASIPPLAYFLSGGDDPAGYIVIPFLHVGGALAATWTCVGKPRLGPIGNPPVPWP